MMTYHDPVLRVDDVDRTLGSFMVTMEDDLTTHSVDQVHIQESCNAKCD